MVVRNSLAVVAACIVVAVVAAAAAVPAAVEQRRVPIHSSGSLPPIWLRDWPCTAAVRKRIPAAIAAFVAGAVERELAVHNSLEALVLAGTVVRTDWRQEQELPGNSWSIVPAAAGVAGTVAHTDWEEPEEQGQGHQN